MTKAHLWALSGVAMLLAALPCRAATVQVTVEKLGFSPANVSVAVGDTIEWINKDFMAHTATADGVFDVQLPPHRSASTVVTKAGTIDYFCRFHPNMRAHLNVSAK